MRLKRSLSDTIEAEMYSVLSLYTVWAARANLYHSIKLKTLCSTIQSLVRARCGHDTKQNRREISKQGRKLIGNKYVNGMCTMHTAYSYVQLKAIRGPINAMKLFISFHSSNKPSGDVHYMSIIRPFIALSYLHSIMKTNTGRRLVRDK